MSSPNIVDNSVTAADLQDGAARAEILDDDGAGSGLDADLLDGEHAASFAPISHGHGFDALSCYVNRVEVDMNPGGSGWSYTWCNGSDRAISCGSCTPQSTVITTMSGYMCTEAVNGGSVPAKCLTTWSNNSTSVQRVYGYATCCPR